MRASGEPQVSVVLPVFNGEPYLESALLSVRRQTHRNLEIIAIDDGSQDRSLAILEDHARRDSRLRVISRPNRGVVATLNEGLDLATGALVARMDADDVAYPDRIRRQAEVFAQRPELAVCASNYDIIFKKSRLQSQVFDDLWQEPNLPILSLFFTVFLHPSVMFNRAVLPSNVLRYDPAYPHAEDLDLFRRILSAYPGHVIREPLLAYRTHASSVSSSRAQEMRRTHLRIVQENLAARGWPTHIPRLLRGAPASDALLAEMAGLLSAVRGLATSAAAREAPAYKAGADRLFFLLLQLALQEYGVTFAARFIDRTSSWDLLRHRERLTLRMFGGAPLLSRLAWRAVCKFDGLERRLRSRSLHPPPALEAS
ncbi:glycosyltransferase [Phenylobacterium sp. J426]|uniref:glycosyltransferase family 2 protein n=1 Tax=Phenylobacterium sp. J426 TaxID=2898439 RepID=UPI002151C5CB|nr:glycosyltransferase [Phenylobacterium sp. J426]MCR5876459.1 glycosyltransferase [Phenylobacterium sp. J426]